MTATKDGDTRERILQVAARLLAESGGEPVSTRAVCAAAGIGAPTLYHHFGDKRGLLNAVVAYGFERYLADKRAMARTGDPVEDMRRGWDLHVGFGLSHPTFYALMYGPQPSGRRSAAAEESYVLLLDMVRTAARAGRLRVPVEEAAGMVFAAGIGVTFTLLGTPEASHGDLSERTREAVLAAVTTGGEGRTGPEEPSAEGAALSAPMARAVVALQASLDPGDPPGGFSGAEVALLREWLGRLAHGPRGGAG
ncbi:TetR/AcrR family transcriptional regulator [Allostreptomyces psammosilenae]|uniref:AcrR family transcriptional regulator n=1 Tax=Allostreptomyces psammosilenae TaxID=1892865 RepID=A0A852ZQZ9_9ACTN|nr:TetR/AcrR family transcriptional regulator [Allostreptomyces psammosilenae]NYI04823.1 AcrR family transcriptional regulator [Allostreptomyces psammosilenae]